MRDLSFWTPEGGPFRTISLKSGIRRYLGEKWTKLSVGDALRIGI
jgi:hypothetical protein